MPFLPFFMMFGILLVGFPKVVPLYLAYFILGSAIGQFFLWAIRRKGITGDRPLAVACAWYCFYAWPIAIIHIIYISATTAKDKTHG